MRNFNRMAVLLLGSHLRLQDEVIVACAKIEMSRR